MAAISYKSSKGPKEIATMPLPYAKNALGKLQREAPERVEEITAITAHVERIEAENAAQENGEPLPREAVIGDNGPPADSAIPITGWEAIKINLDDLLTEAKAWADGEPLVNQGQADTLTKVKEKLEGAMSAAEVARLAEKKPLDEQINEIQARYNAYIAPKANKVPGTATKAMLALNRLLSGWLNKLDEEKKAREQEAAAAAGAAAAEALAAHQEAKVSTDIAVLDRAEDSMANAEALLRQAKGVGAEKVQARGESRAYNLRSYWTARLIDRTDDTPGGGAAAMRHYLATKPERIQEFLTTLAQADVHAGARAIPGFTITEEKRL